MLPVRNLLSPSFSPKSISYKRMIILAIWRRFRWFLAIFYCACTETAISELPATIMTTPSDSATTISCKRRQFRQSESIYRNVGHFFFAHAQIRHYLCFRSEICYHRRSQRHRFPVKGWKFCDLTTFMMILILAIFLLRMRRNSYFWASGYNNYDNAIGFSDPDFRLGKFLINGW